LPALGTLAETMANLIEPSGQRFLTSVWVGSAPICRALVACPCGSASPKVAQPAVRPTVATVPLVWAVGRVCALARTTASVVTRILTRGAAHAARQVRGMNMARRAARPAPDHCAASTYATSDLRCEKLRNRAFSLMREESQRGPSRGDHVFRDESPTLSVLAGLPDSAGGDRAEQHDRDEHHRGDRRLLQTLLRAGLLRHERRRRVREGLARRRQRPLRGRAPRRTRE